jgi:DNA-binding CsgD family transcriptional regulator
MDLRKAGLTLKETADQLGMSITTVWRQEQAHVAEALT